MWLLKYQITLFDVLKLAHDLTCDIVSLYTNIPHKLGLRALLYYIIKYRNPIQIRFSEEFILEAAEFMLKNNNFIWLEEIFN